MMRAARAAVVLIPLAVLIHQAATGRFCTFRRLFSQQELNDRLCKAVDTSAGAPEAIRLLLRTGADANAKGYWGRTALHLAAKLGRKDVAELLLDHGADPNAGDNTGETPLHVAAEHGGEAYSRTPPSCGGRYEEIVELLILHGADVNVRSKQDFTPLALALMHGGHEGIAKMLVANGADIRARMRDGLTVKDGVTPLHLAACLPRNSLAEFLIRMGADIEARTNHGATPLHQAASWGSKAVAELLIEKGADVNARTETGYTPLHGAASGVGYLDGGHKEVVELLLAKGADVNARFKTERELMPLDLATGPPEVMAALVRYGGLSMDEIIPPLCDLQRDLQKAAIAGDEERCRVLLGGEWNIHAKNAYGLTLLHWAVLRGFKEIVAHLLRKGADVNATIVLYGAGVRIYATDGYPISLHGGTWTALDMAEHIRRNDIADLLRQHGGKSAKELK